MTELDAQSTGEPGDREPAGAAQPARPASTTSTDSGYDDSGPLFAGLDLDVDDSDDNLFGYPTGPRADTGAGTAAPRRRRHIGRYVAGGLAVGVLAVGVFTGPTLSHVFSARNTSVTWPDQVAGLSRDTSADSTDTANYLRDAVNSGSSLAHPTAAVYNIGGDKSHSVLLFGGTGAIYRPANELSKVLGLLDDSQDSVTGLHEVSPGPLGGEMKCGTSVGSGDATDPDMPICAWADHGSAMGALFPGRTVDEAAELFRQFRAAIEKR